MLHRLRRFILFSLLGSSYGFLSYYWFGGWWNSSLGTILILLLSYLIWKKGFLEFIGLQLNFKTIAKSIILTLFIAICAFWTMKSIAAKHHVEISYTNWRNYYHDIFYILNEEIVIGALLLFYLVNKRKFQPIIASIGLAVFFSMIHFVLYKWIMRDKGILEITTLLTLLFVGFVRNSLILQTGHIGYSWALHFGWMIVMFGSMHVDSDTHLLIREPERFNLYLGSIEMLLISTIMAGLFIIVWIKKNKIQSISLK